MGAPATKSDVSASVNRKSHLHMMYSVGIESIQNREEEVGNERYLHLAGDETLYCYYALS